MLPGTKLTRTPPGLRLRLPPEDGRSHDAIPAQIVPSSRGFHLLGRPCGAFGAAEMRCRCSARSSTRWSGPLPTNWNRQMNPAKALVNRDSGPWFLLNDTTLRPSWDPAGWAPAAPHRSLGHHPLTAPIRQAPAPSWRCPQRLRLGTPRSISQPWMRYSSPP